MSFETYIARLIASWFVTEKETLSNRGKKIQIQNIPIRMLNTCTKTCFALREHTFMMHGSCCSGLRTKMAVGVHRVVFQHSRGTETSLAIVTHMEENSAKRAGSYHVSMVRSLYCISRDCKKLTNSYASPSVGTARPACANHRSNVWWNVWWSWLAHHIPNIRPTD